MRFWYSPTVAAQTMLKGMYQIHDATIALLLPHEEFVDLLGSAVDLFEETTVEGPIALKGITKFLFPRHLKTQVRIVYKSLVTVPSLSRPRD